MLTRIFRNVRPLSTVAAATVMCVLWAFAAPVAHAQRTINGAGATFPYPVYSQWAYKYNNLTNVQLNYQSIGSGAGIAQIQAKTVDFGASDAPMTPEELTAGGLVQFPTVLGGVVPVVNIEGVAPGALRLSSDVLADIYLGTIKNWSDPRIMALNPGLTLPPRAITVVHRSDGSGTTWIYTTYLAEVSPAWNEAVGAGKAVSWPAGIGGKGNEGVAAYVQRINGAVGYVEYAYALQNKLAHVMLQNRDGQFVQPNIDTFQAAAANADWKEAQGFSIVLTNQPGATSWPITGATFIIMYREQKNPVIAKAVLDFFNWCFTHGDDIAVDLNYVPLPDNVIAMVQAMWATDITSGAAPIWSN